MKNLSSISGNLAILREYNKPEIVQVSYLPKRLDTLSINIQSLDCKNELEIDSYIDYFGNILRYKKQPTLSTEWNNVKDLYKIIEKLSFLNSGILDTGTYEPYLEEGYLLSYCPGCVQKTYLSLPDNELDTLFFSGDITLEYNSFKILKNSEKILSPQILTGDLIQEDFINFKISDSSIFKYKKDFLSTTKPTSRIFKPLGAINDISTPFAKEKPFYWDDINLNSKFITAISEDRSINNNYLDQINKSIFSGKAISGYEVVPNSVDKYEKIQGHTILSNIDHLPLKEHARELYLSLYSGVEAFQYEIDEEALPKVKKVYDFETSTFKYRANKYKNTQKNNFYKPAAYEKHIVLFDVNLYGFSGEAPEECDAEVNAYILNEGEFIDTIKNPIPLKIKIKDLKNYVTGKIEKYTDIIKEKDLITGFKLKTNVSYDNSYFNDNKKFPYDIIKMEVNVAAPPRYCQDVPQFYLLKDENLKNFNRLRSYNLTVYDKKNSKIINSGIFISGIQTGFLVALKPGLYDFVLSGTEKLFVENNYSGLLDDNLNPYIPEYPKYEFYTCQPVFCRIINNNKIYSGDFVSEGLNFSISGKHEKISEKMASYYEYKINNEIYRADKLTFNYTGLLGNIYTGEMRSVCSDCQPIELYIKNNNVTYNENVGLINTPFTFIEISGKPLGKGIYPCSKYEISINDRVFVSQKPTFNFFGESGSYYTIKMRGVCDFDL